MLDTTRTPCSSWAAARARRPARRGEPVARRAAGPTSTAPVATALPAAALLTASVAAPAMATAPSAARRRRVAVASEAQWLVDLAL